MTDVHHPDWDDAELVPLGDLRPSREYFGPVGASNDKKKKPQPREQQKPQRRPERPAQARNGERRPRPVRQEQEQPQRSRREPEIDLRDQRPARRPVPAARTQEERPAPQQRPEVRQRRPEPRPEAREQRPEAREQRPARRPEPRRQQRPQPEAAKPAGLRGKLGMSSASAPAASGDIREVINAPVIDGTLAVFSRKGGVGKTTISAYLGLTLASLRGGRIMAIDGDAEAGSLGWLMAPKAPATLAALSTAQPTPSTFNDLRGYTAATPGGLDIVVGDTDGREVVDQAGLEDVLVQIARNYDMSIFDTGGGVSVSAGRVLVKHAKVMLLVMGPSVDSIRAAERTLAWVNERPGEAADPNVQIIAVINGVPNTVKEAHVQRIEEHFAERCAAVVRIPWDEHLANGTTDVSLDAISKGTRKAFANLAATTVKVMATRDRKLQGGRRAS